MLKGNMVVSLDKSMQLLFPRDEPTQQPSNSFVIIPGKGNPAFDVLLLATVLDSDQGENEQPALFLCQNRLRQSKMSASAVIKDLYYLCIKYCGGLFQSGTKRTEHANSYSLPDVEEKDVVFVMVLLNGTTKTAMNR